MKERIEEMEGDGKREVKKKKILEWAEVLYYIYKY